MQREYWNWNCHHGANKQQQRPVLGQNGFSQSAHGTHGTTILYTPSSSSSSLAKVWHKVKRVVECLLGQNHYIRSQVFVSILLLPILLLHILLLLLLKYGTRRIRWRGWQSTNWLGFLLELSRLTALYFSTVFLKCISRVYSSSVFLYFSSLLSSVFLNLSYCCIYNSKENWLGSHSLIALHYAFIKCIFVFSILKVF